MAEPRLQVQSPTLGNKYVRAAVAAAAAAAAAVRSFSLLFDKRIVPGVWVEVARDP